MESTTRKASRPFCPAPSPSAMRVVRTAARKFSQSFRRERPSSSTPSTPPRGTRGLERSGRRKAPRSEKLAWHCRRLSRAGGRGERWVLVPAPIGWAENIASQFVNERDYGGQTISYKPGNTTGKKESDLPQELLIAFRGDEEMTRKFMDKVATLPSDRLDDHIVQSCGRARVKAHLEEISGDPDFFMGADPNRVAFYVATVHFSKMSLGKTQLA